MFFFDAPCRQTELKYLGIIIQSKQVFTVSILSARQKFFRAVNCIFGKIGLKTSLVVLCSLIQSICIPVLLYATEALDLSSSNLNSLNQAYTQALAKVFGSFDRIVIEQCQFYLRLLPLKNLLDVRKLNFLTDHGKPIDTYSKLYSAQPTHHNLCDFYKFPYDVSNYNRLMQCNYEDYIYKTYLLVN